MNSNWRYSPETVKWSFVLCDLDLWPWPFAWTSLLSMIIRPENLIIKVEYRTGIPSVMRIHPHRDGYWSYPHISSINCLRLLPHLAMSFEGRAFTSHLPQKTSVSRVIMLEYRTGIPSVMQIHPHGDEHWSNLYISSINYLRLLPHLVMSFEGRAFSSHLPQKTLVSRSIRLVIMVEYRTGMPSGDVLCGPCLF